ncbi:hypothetical protein T484DRAFT_1806979, partial [Baffinella frigidus]
MKHTASATVPAEGENLGDKVALSIAWSCPKHNVACECLPWDLAAGDIMELENVVREQWKSDGDREAVLRKLRDAGIRSCSSLKKCLHTPVWDAKIPRACWFRGSPNLLNQLVQENQGSKLLRSPTLEELAKRCRGEADLAEVEKSLTEFFSEIEAGVVEEAVSVLLDSGLWTLTEVRAALLLPASDLGLSSDVRQRLGAILCRAPACRHQPGATTSAEGGDHVCALDQFLPQAGTLEPALLVAVGSAADSEGEAKRMREHLKRCGILGLWDMRRCLYTTVTEVHPKEHLFFGQATALNQLIRTSLGK